MFLGLPQTAVRKTFSPFRLATSACRYASNSTTNHPAKVAFSEPSKPIASLCPAGTVMTGLNYLKGEPPVLAKPDDEYPAWLWSLTNPNRALSGIADDGPGGKAEKRRLRLQHRQALKDSNLFRAK